jgi:hypothetical protein
MTRGGRIEVGYGTLRRLQREQERSPFVFTSERGAPFGTASFARMVERAGVEAKLGFKVHPHMLRHACGYALANRGHDTRALQAYWVTKISSTRCATPSCRRLGSRTFGASNDSHPYPLYPRKRTWRNAVGMSALCQKRTTGRARVPTPVCHFWSIARALLALL